jgi:uncharacterized protein with FMN-binding domain
MNEETEINQKRQLSTTLVALVIVVIIVFGVVILTKKKPASVSTNSTSSSTSRTTPPAKTSNAATATAQTYKDGTYSATGTYDSPGGTDQLGVSITLSNDVVTASSVKSEAGDQTSQQYEDTFIQNYKQFVVGKSIGALEPSQVSGASLTVQGFNDAIQQIENQAHN